MSARTRSYSRKESIIKIFFDKGTLYIIELLHRLLCDAKFTSLIQWLTIFGRQKNTLNSKFLSKPPRRAPSHYVTLTLKHNVTFERNAVLRSGKIGWWIWLASPWRVSYIDYGATERPVMTSKISKKKVRH